MSADDLVDGPVRAGPGRSGDAAASLPDAADLGRLRGRPARRWGRNLSRSVPAARFRVAAAS
ncbi:hypothetical protein ACU4GD_03270 [Cupriavidus basilensis]